LNRSYLILLLLLLPFFVSPCLASTNEEAVAGDKQELTAEDRKILDMLELLEMLELLDNMEDIAALEDN